MSTTELSPLLRLEHVALQVSNLEESVAWYRDVVGLAEVSRTAEKVYLAVGSKPTWDLSLVEGGTGLEYFSFSVNDLDVLAQTAGRLRSAQIEVTDVEELDPLILAAVEMSLPGGQKLRLVVPEARMIYTVATDVYFGGIWGPKELHHVTLAVNDLPALERFLVEHLDFAISDHVHWGPGGPLGLAFWRVAENHHDVAAISAGADGLHHFAFVVSGIGDLVAIADRLAGSGFRSIVNGISRHGAGNNLFLYALDPTGNIVEFSTDLSRITDRGAAYRVWEHAEVSGNLWGSVTPTPAFLHTVT